MQFFFGGNPSVAEPLQCAKGSSAESCVQKNIRDGCLVHTVLPDEFVVKSKFGSGLSGAFVYIVTRKNDPTNSEYVLKYYTDAYQAGSDGKIIENDRPFREVVILCALSGIQGFPCLFQSGCAKRPPTEIWGVKKTASEVGLYAVMSKVEGKSLMDMNLKKDLNSEWALAISLRILALLKSAQDVLGDDFEHFDLHPGNIIVDVKSCFPMEIKVSNKKRLRVNCPSVTIIDFDLSSASVLEKNLPPRPARHEWTKDLGPAKVIAFQERTVTWAQKWVGSAQTAAFVREISSVDRTDIRQWMLITRVLLATHPLIRGSVAMCTDAIKCLQNNFDLFRNYFYGGGITGRMGTMTTRRYETQRMLDELAEKQAPPPSASDGAVKFNPLNLLFEDVTWGSTRWNEFEQLAHRKIGFFPTLDTIDIVAQCAFERRFLLKILDAVLVEMSNFNLSIGFPQTTPTIKIQFPDPLKVGIISWDAVKTILANFIRWFTSYYQGKQVMQFWRQEVFCGVENPLQPSFQSFDSEMSYFSYGVFYITEIAFIYRKTVLDLKMTIKIPSAVVGYFAARFMKHVVGDIYEFSTQISMEGEPNPCMVGKSEECRAFLHSLLLPFLDILLSKPMFDMFRQVGVPASLVSIRDSASGIKLPLRFPEPTRAIKDLAAAMSQALSLFKSAYSYADIIKLVMSNDKSREKIVKVGKAILDLERFKVKLGVLDILQIIGQIMSNIPHTSGFKPDILQ